MRKGLTIFVLVTALALTAIFGWLDRSSTKDSETRADSVGLTYQSRKEPCITRPNETCNVPDPAGVVAELRLPPRVRADDRDSRYEHSIRLNVFVTENEVKPFPHDMSIEEIEQKNYALGLWGNIELVSWRPDESFENYLKDGVMLASVVQPGEYRLQDDSHPGYLTYDTDECAQLLPKDLVPSESNRHQSCYSKGIIYTPKKHEWSYLDCPRRFTQPNGRTSTPVCWVWSRVIPGLFMRYQISGAYVDDLSWVDYDKRIRTYIISLVNAERKGG